MGKIKWEAYRPKDINQKARSLANAYSRHEKDIEIGRLNKENKIGLEKFGLAFVLITATLLVVTWIRFM